MKAIKQNRKSWEYLETWFSTGVNADSFVPYHTSKKNFRDLSDDGMLYIFKQMSQRCENGFFFFLLILFRLIFVLFRVLKGKHFDVAVAAAADRDRLLAQVDKKLEDIGAENDSSLDGQQSIRLANFKEQLLSGGIDELRMKKSAEALDLITKYILKGSGLDEPTPSENQPTPSVDQQMERERISMDKYFESQKVAEDTQAEAVEEKKQKVA